ncbi:hypothetical protein [Kitasatospora kazusensis]
MPDDARASLLSVSPTEAEPDDQVEPEGPALEPVRDSATLARLRAAVAEINNRPPGVR